MMFRLNETVRVVQLLHPPEEYDVLEENIRPPAIGDRGLIVDVVCEAGKPAIYIVECVDADGVGVWIGDFDAEELELVP